jgi:hypothetical protein
MEDFLTIVLKGVGWGLGIGLGIIAFGLVLKINLKVVTWWNRTKSES